MKTNRLLKTLHWLQLLVWGVLIFFYWNPNQVDTLGHLSGAVSFNRFGFHGFNDQFFTGVIQNLFYPPLHDFLLGLFLRVGLTPFVALKIFEMGVISAFLWMLYRLSMQFQKARTQLLFYGLMLAWIYRGKDNLLLFQGLGLVDFLITGLLPQFLGGVFFFLILYELRREKVRVSVLVASLVGAILSHLIMGLCSVLLLAVHEGLRNRETTIRLFKVYCWSAILSAFWWVPFLNAREYLVSSTVTSKISYGFVGSLLVFFCLGTRKFKFRRLTVLAVLLYLPEFLSLQIQGFGGVLPKFHYYRLGIISAFLFVWDGVQFLETEAVGWRRGLGFTCLLIGTLSTYCIQDFSQPGMRLGGGKEIRIAGDLPVGQDSPYRWWIAGPNRSIDFSLDSYLAIQNSNFKSVKGLWWESHRDHSLASSYFATLMSTPVVLDHVFFKEFNCEVQRCMEKNFARTFGVQGVLLGLDRMTIPEVKRKSECFYRYPSPHVIPSAVEFDDVQFQAHFYPNVPENEVIESVDSDSLIYQADLDPWSFSHPLGVAYQDCVDHRLRYRLFVRGSFREGLLRELGPVPLKAQRLSWEKKENGIYEVRPEGRGLTLTWVKLSVYPGLRVRKVSTGEDLSVYDANPGFVVVSDSAFRIEYQKSRAHVYGMLISILGLFGILIIKRNQFKSPI